MAKLTGPLFSLGAHGKLGKDLIYQSGRDARSVKVYKTPTDRKTDEQRAVRSIFKSAVDFWHTPSRPLKVVLFSGDSSSYATVTQSASINLSSNLTMSAWIQPATLSETGYVFSKGNPYDGVYNLWWDGGPGRLVFVDLKGVARWVPAAATTSWVHVAASLAQKTILFYINGAFVGTASLADELPASTAHLFIGSRLGGSQSFHSFAGHMRDLRLFDRVLPVSEVAQVYAGADCEGCVMKLNTARSFGTSLPDSIGNNNATLLSTTFDFVPNTGQVVFYDDHAAWSNAARYFRKHQNGYIAFCKNAFLAAQQLPSASFFVKTLNTAADNIRLEMRELDSREGGTEAGSFRAVVSSLPTGPVNVYTTSGTAEELILDVSDVFDPGDSVWIQLSKELPDGTRIDRSGLINIVLT